MSGGFGIVGEKVLVRKDEVDGYVLCYIQVDGPPKGFKFLGYKFVGR